MGEYPIDPTLAVPQPEMDVQQDMIDPEAAGASARMEQEALQTPEAQAQIQQQAQMDPGDQAKAFKDLLLDARREDEQVRWEYMRVWKKLEYYWENILDVFFDPVAKDWRVPDWDLLEDEIPPRLINIYRPHGEAIVAALSVDIPSVVFHPDDADNPDDIETAKAYRTITDLLALHNDAPMLFIRAIKIAFNQGTIFGYNYYHTDPKFGTYAKPKIENKDIEIFQAYCPNCGANLDTGLIGMQQGAYRCEVCKYQGRGDMQTSTETIPQIVGFDKSPKGSVCQEVFSGLNVKVPMFARKQDECGYLLLEFNQATAMLRSIYKAKAEKIQSKVDNWSYQDQFFKTPIQYLGEIPDNASAVSCLWLRPWYFWNLNANRPDIIQQLVAQFPEGCYAIFINDEFMEVYPENFDAHWTISKNPLGEFIHARPMGENLATVQNIRADLVEIELQTAEHGIPETFADPKVLDFTQYGKGRSQPGMVTQAIPRPGKSLNDAFYSTKAATLSQEIDPIRQHVDQDAQFVVGSFPSVYGGPATGGSKTASEYSQSRSIALQRLGSVWKMMCHFWSEFQSKSAVEYAETLKEFNRDEKFTKREGLNSFVNVWIRISTLSGRIGRVEPEASEQLPSTWAQKHDSIMQLLTTGIPEILSVLVNPRNANFMKNATGLKDLYIPGEDSQIRQYKEFQLLSQGIPVPINPIVDNHQVHAEVLQAILEGPQGEGLDEIAKQVSEMHLMQHQQILAQQQAQMDQAAEQSDAGDGNGGKEKREKVQQ